MLKSIDPTSTSSWKSLQASYQKHHNKTIAEILKDEPKRVEKLSIPFEDEFLVDLSKNRLTQETLEILYQLVDECDLNGAIEAMYSGEKINRTEDRAVLHVALRNVSNSPIYVDGKNVMDDVNAVLAKINDALCFKC